MPAFFIWDDLAMGLSEIRARIATAEAAANRPPASVTLIAVSKVQPAERVTAVLAQGQRVFGENYVQETARKWPEWRDAWPDVQLHMIGPLQTNKVKAAFDLFNVIQSVDRPSLAEKIARQAQAAGRCPQLFVQVNTGAEPQKAGILPADAPAFIARCRAMDLAPQGLMCIPPEGKDSAPHFRLLGQIAADCGVAALSMGMSADFETAIALGATHVRVGSAIFGARAYT